jgi:lipoyl(octanoyl) transferase
MEPLKALTGLVAHEHVQLPIIDANLTMSYEGFVGVDVEWIVFHRIQFDHRAAPHAQQMMDGHGGCAELDGDFHFNIVESVHRYLFNPALQKGDPRLMVVSEALTAPADCNAAGKLRRADAEPVRWIIAPEPVPYPLALAAMRHRAAAISDGTAAEAVWLVEHPPLYTAGTSAVAGDLLWDRFPVYDAGRGGQYTYHGPGQRVAYLMLDLRQRGRDIRCLVQGLEGWVIDTLAAHNIVGERRSGRIGVWVKRPDKGPGREDKIAAIGVRLSKWVTFHGISLNIAPDLGHYDGIVPCGITDQGVTSFEDLGQLVSMPEVDSVLRGQFERRFGSTVDGMAEELVPAAITAQVER